jgi:ribosomal protein S11
MPHFQISLPNATDPARVVMFLAAKGYVVADGVSIMTDGTVVFDADRDPTADLAAYTNAPTATEQLKQDALTAVNAYLVFVNALPVATRTHEQNVLLALLVLLPGVT